ncbi:tetratricopeptide repeat protein [Flavobacterium branchiophilum]|uniref:Tetratricopeptide repeat protein n=3 Tax=Flavobacterium branchiophilum TaxID=55197 RepID=A0A543G3J1_9FLAO|nr:tetratricopeptide repeat protein [Flavobacterium branchiophilum]TQM40584.1 tetratricopeptide repeat protein [Flavobacterium branchiophilum]
MKKIILIVLLSLSYLSYSQLDSISYYNGKGDLLNALRCSDKMNLSKSNSDYVELLTWKAELQYEIGNIKESEKYYRIIENGLDSLKNEFIGKEFYRHEIGVVYFDNNKLEEAEKNFSIHINEIKDNDNRVINSIEFIAEISKKNENYNKADSLYQKVIELRILKNGKDEMYSKTLTLYAQLKEKEKKYESAESLYNESIKINSTLQNNNYKPNVFKAMMFSDIKRYKEASCFSPLNNRTEL